MFASTSGLSAPLTTLADSEPLKYFSRPPCELFTFYIFLLSSWECMYSNINMLAGQDVSPQPANDKMVLTSDNIRPLNWLTPDMSP